MKEVSITSRAVTNTFSDLYINSRQNCRKQGDGPLEAFLHTALASESGAE